MGLTEKDRVTAFRAVAPDGDLRKLGRGWQWDEYRAGRWPLTQEQVRAKELELLAVFDKFGV